MFAVIWSLLIAFLVVPWYGLQDHSHWQRVRWVPFVETPAAPVDMVLNILLYVPLGIALAMRPAPSSWRRVLIWAVLLSLTTEWSQVYSHGRVPSTTDLVTNVVGAWLGAVVWLRWRAQNAQDARGSRVSALIDSDLSIERRNG